MLIIYSSLHGIILFADVNVNRFLAKKSYTKNNNKLKYCNVNDQKKQVFTYLVDEELWDMW